LVSDGENKEIQQLHQQLAEAEAAHQRLRAALAQLQTKWRDEAKEYGPLLISTKMAYYDCANELQALAESQP